MTDIDLLDQRENELSSALIQGDALANDNYGYQANLDNLHSVDKAGSK